MFTEKKTKTTLSKALALGMVATSVSLAGQTATADATNKENTDTTSIYKTQTQTYTTKTGTVTASALNIRKGPSTSYAIVGSLKSGQTVTITETDSATGWYKIKTSAGVVGYVSNHYIKVAGQVNTGGSTGGNTTTTPSTTTKTGTVTATSLYVRSGPSTAHSIVTTLSKGHVVTITGTASTGWHQVKTATGKSGYVGPNYIKVSSTTSGDTNNGSTNNGNTNTGSNNSQTGVYVVQSYSTISKVGKVNTNSLNVRSGPSTSYGVKGSVTKGNVVGILKQYSNGWYEVKLANGTTGCVSGSYLTITAGTSSDITSGTTSGGTNTGGNTGTSTNVSAKVQAVVNMVKAQVGKPYVWGATGPSSFDCSGLTYYCYRNAAGITLNRTSSAQASNGRYVSKSNLQPGDLVFFNSGTSTIRHVGMYVGNGQFIHAPAPGQRVKYENLYSSYYVRGYVTARRIIG